MKKLKRPSENDFRTVFYFISVFTTLASYLYVCRGSLINIKYRQDLN